jgi:hypothetical protein
LERVVLEMLYLVPEKIIPNETYQIIELLITVKPKAFQMLLYSIRLRLHIGYIKILAIKKRVWKFSFFWSGSKVGTPSLSLILSLELEQRRSHSHLRVFANIPLNKKDPRIVSLFYGAGDEARTRDIFLGKYT